jgi:fumarate hydratase class II
MLLEPHATRTEHDTLGEVKVPADAYYGAATGRSIEYFAIGPDLMPLRIVHALARIKRAAASVNAELGLLPAETAALIERSAGELLDGLRDDEFPLSIYQTGSGTQTNMNVNEVIAGRANEMATGARGGKSPVHPNDHVNLGQSSNDTFPAAIRLAVVAALADELFPTLHELGVALEAKRDAWADLPALGRTHLQDAVPLPFGRWIGAHATTLAANRERLLAARNELYALPLGATAVGTGLGTHPDFGRRVAARLARELEHPFGVVAYPFAALAGAEAELALSAALRSTAVSLHRLADDVRLLASGPRGGIGELVLPANEPGSSIMPGKVNPTQAEALVMVSLQVGGLDAAIAQAAAAGSLQLNTARPLIGANLLTAIRLLADAARSFARHCIAGAEPNRERIAANLAASLMLATALVPAVGYDRAAAIARDAHERGVTLRDAALASGHIDAATFDALTNPAELAHGGAKQ